MRRCTETAVRMAAVFEEVAAVVFAKDVDGRYLFVNRAFERLTGARAADIVGRRDVDLFLPEIAAGFARHDRQVIARRRALEFDEITQVGSERRIYAAVKFPLFDDDGEVVCVWGLANDVTARRNMERALQESALAVSSAGSDRVFQELARYLATILDADYAFIGELRADDPSRVRTVGIYGDGAYQENMEYEVALTPCRTVVGQGFRLFCSGLRERFPGDNQLAELGLQAYAGYPLSDSCGCPLGVVAVLSRRSLNNAELVESVLKIVAVRVVAELERRRAEQALRASEASYRAIFDAAEDAIFVHQPDTGAIVDANPKACSAYGYTREELRGLGIGALSSGEPPYTGAEAARLLARARESPAPLHFEWHRRNKDGSLHWDELVLTRAEIAGEPRLLVFSREITERERAEARRAQLEAQLRQAQKMEAIGQLTGGIAHDFNNLLTSILGYVVLAGEQASARPDGDPTLARYLDQARLSCERARDLIRQMLTFSRGQRGEPRPLALAALVRESIGLARSSFPASVEIRCALAERVPAVMADPVLIEQVLLNLCINARDAMNGSGTITVSLRHAWAVRGSCCSCRQPVAGDFVELAVADTGSGIAPEHLDRIFEPFFSTKGVGRGSGMGLAMVHGIVHELGGHVLVDSEVGQGARFRVMLRPLAAALTPANGLAAAAPGLPVGRLAGRVLLVDDEPAVLDFMRELLERWGLTVRACADPAAARAVLEDPAEDCELLLSDQTMPGLTGVELAGLARRQRAALPVVLYSGYSGALAATAPAAGVVAVLDKPVDPQRLFEVLAAHLPAA
ncbi:PAS domain-containing hybrid sensor histidine kinase/response regulator [Thauera phenolivorans]|uniref:PAS domain-containing hybrid sensor histidine kinase/response regulator n=1 Tax=Thauera phenolivorans TaxID=1792543 RepID=UPI00083A011A|nr:PAS domain S-box protein [Thauera phenolivorans]